MLVSGNVTLYNFNKITYREIIYSDIIKIIDGTNSGIISELDDAYNIINNLTRYSNYSDTSFSLYREEIDTFYKRLTAYSDYFDMGSDVGYFILEAFIGTGKQSSTDR